MIGQSVAHYEITDRLGAGGMGEVYRATDTRLNRQVALKVLPPVFAQDAQRMGRFEREAQVLASLNHPNIASIYGLEEANGTRVLVMELVEGEDLSERIARGPIPLEEALPIARQVAAALEDAHEKGIIHRDLKPANIKLNPDGKVKVLDFGLAKALEDPVSKTESNGVSRSPTLSMAATQAGVILGTAAYMSPEQARGRPVDKRTDIWSFGVVLFEMLSGRKPFEGDTVTDVLASVVTSEPDCSRLPAATSSRVHALIRRCLMKDPKQRVRDIGDARISIEEAISGAAVDAEASAQGGGTPLRSARQGAVSWVAASVVLICLAAIAGWWIRGREATQNPRWSGDLLAGSSIAFGPRVSPDGRTLAFLAMVDNQTQVAVVNPDSGNWTVLTGDRSVGTVDKIAWSPDGSKLYLDRIMNKLPQGIYSVPSLGGDERLVLKDAAGPEPLPDGSLLIWQVDEERRDRLYHFWPDSGRIEPLRAWIAPTYPVAMYRAFPDGKEAVFYGWDTGAAAGASPNLYAIDFASGQTRRLAPQLPIRLTTAGFPMALPPDNRSVLIDLPSGNLHQIVAIPRSGSGQVRVLMSLTTPPWSLDMGPDGSLYADQVERPYQILRFPTSGGAPEVLATSPAFSVAISAPVEFPDGRFLIPALDSGRSRLLIGKPGRNFFPFSDTKEETRLPATLLPGGQVAFVARTGSEQTIVVASAEDGRISRRLQGCKGNYVTSLASSRDGQTLYYSAQGAIWAISVDDGKPQKVAPGDGVVVDPNGKDLIINLLERSGETLFRVPLSGGSPQRIQIQDNAVLDPLPLGEHSLNQDGQLVIGVTEPDSWFFSAAVLDLATGRVQKISLNFTGDIMQSKWTDDGRILAQAEPIQAHIWRFKPVGK
jgi:hypothetical protein